MADTTETTAGSTVTPATTEAAQQAGQSPAVDGQIHVYITDVIRDIEGAGNKVLAYLQQHVDVASIEKHLAAVKAELGSAIGLELDKYNNLTPKS